MTQPITPETAPAPLHSSTVNVDGQQWISDEYDDEFLVERDDPEGISLERLRRRLVLMTGSHHMHIFWYETGRGRMVGQLPIVYLKDEQTWIPRRSAFLTPPNGVSPSATGA
jgi:hypothetical protein